MRPMQAQIHPTARYSLRHRKSRQILAIRLDPLVPDMPDLRKLLPNNPRQDLWRVESVLLTTRPASSSRIIQD